VAAGPPVTVRVWGDFACFTRPEMHVERVSYPVMTPSAARGVLESIFWKPEFSWRVQRIAVLRPIRHFAVLRNETTEKPTPGSILDLLRKGGRHSPLVIDDDSRAQRNTLGLRDVAYRIEARVHLREGAAPKDEVKCREQFARRINRGQCYLRPCLGCREFAAHFGPADDAEPSVDVTEDLGQVLFDIRYEQGTGRGTPAFFEAHLEAGVLCVPQHLYEEVGL